MTKTEQSSEDLWDNIKQSNIHAMAIPEREETEYGAEQIFSGIMAQNCPILIVHY